MTIVDTSVIAAILLLEPDAFELGHRLDRAERRLMSAANWLEAAMVAARLGDDGQAMLDEFIHRATIEIVPVTPEQASIARDAFLRFGKGGGGKPGLNFGDCFAYALARSLKAPLLYKGSDFAATDIVAA